MSQRPIFILIALIASFSSWIAAEPTESPQVIALDLDSMIVEQKTKIYRTVDRRENVRVGPRIQQIPPFLPEFLAALHFYFREQLPGGLRLAIFSTGAHSANTNLVGNLRLNSQVDLSDLFSIFDIKSAEDLTKNSTEPYGQYYSRFSKDLSVFGQPLNKVVIFDDNFNAIPTGQRANMILLARPDIYEETLFRNRRLSDIHWADPGLLNPIQVARARYRLIRAIGVLSVAMKSIASNSKLVGGRSLPELLDVIQWTPDYRFRAKEVNSQRIYEEGMRILSLTYTNYLEPNSPQFPRPANYFTIQPTFPRVEDCSKYLTSSNGFYPWGPVSPATD